MKNIYPIIIFYLLFYYSANAQYVLEMRNQSYTELTNPTYEIPDSSIYFGNVTEKPDMYFDAFGKEYDLYDGVDIPIKQGYFFFINNDYSTTVYPAKGEYGARPGQGQTSIFSFATEGTAGDRIHTLQWKNMGFKNGDSSDYINFQVRLYENNGFIEFHYGPSSVGVNLYEGGANGPTVGLLEMDAIFSTIYNSYWLQGSPSAPSVISSSNVVNLDNTPVEGTVYRFKPDLSTSISATELGPEKICVYPTLIGQEGKLNINTGLSNYTCSIYDFTGKEVQSSSGLSGTEVIDLTGLSAGIFMVSVNGTYVTKIVVK